MLQKPTGGSTVCVEASIEYENVHSATLILASTLLLLLDIIERRVDCIECMYECMY